MFPVEVPDSFFTTSVPLEASVACARRMRPEAVPMISRPSPASAAPELQSSSKLEQIFEVLVLGEYVSFYLSMLYDIDPAPIPWVDYFKKKLAKG
jgi:hypothetical protein